MRWTPQLPSEVAGRITPALGGGGVAAWLAFLTTHQVSTTAVIAGTAVVCVTVVSHCVAKCLGPRYQHRAEIIEAAAKAKTIEMKATSDAEIRKRREELLTSLLDEIHADPSMAGQADRLLAYHLLAALSEQRDVSEELVKYGQLILSVGGVNAATHADTEADEGPGSVVRRAV